MCVVINYEYTELMCLLSFQRAGLDHDYQWKKERHAYTTGLLGQKAGIFVMAGEQRVGEAETYLGEKWEDYRGGCARQLWLAEKV